MRKVGRKTIRKVAQAVQDSDDNSEEEGVSPFDFNEKTPAFKNADKMKMMITRS